MSEVDVTPRSRRAILGAALGGVAASVAAALGRPAPAQGANGDPIQLGSTNNQASSVTMITTVGTNAIGVSLSGGDVALQSTGNTIGVTGQTPGVGAKGVAGYALNSTGTGTGVYGASGAADGVGVQGLSVKSSTGVFGYSGNDANPPANPDKVGVYGYAAQDSAARGVKGATTGGTGVEGTATTGTGVRASSASGTALAVSGRATFSRSGRASIPANKRYVDITPAGGLSPTTLVVATLETYRSGRWVTVARKNYPTTGKVRIYLNKVASTTASTTIGWVAIN